MHPRLRRQLDAASLREISPPLRKLLDSVDAEYRERDELQESLRTLSSLLHKAHAREEETEVAWSRRRAAAGRVARKLGRVLDRSRVPVMELSPELVVRRGNEAAARRALGLAGSGAPRGRGGAALGARRALRGPHRVAGARAPAAGRERRMALAGGARDGPARHGGRGGAGGRADDRRDPLAPADR